jgi:membrane protein DedA with SNARE-associated domain
VHVETFLVRHGLLAVFAGAMFEGDLTMVMAGVVAHLGYLPLSSAVEAACLGAFAGDLVWYGLGRRGAAAVRESAVYRHAAPLIGRLAARVGEAEIVMARFVYGTRIASMVFWGVHGLPLARFAAFDLFGCALAAVLLGILGYGLSESALAMFGRVQRAERWLALAAIAGASLLLSIRALGRRAARAR